MNTFLLPFATTRYHVLMAALLCALTGSLSIPGVAAPTPAKANFNTGLAARYTFDEGGGDVAVDHSAGGHHGRVDGCLFVKSDRGFALDVNGVGNGSQQVDCGDIDIKGELTIAFWVYAYVWEPDWNGLVYKSDETYGIRNSARQPGHLHFRAAGRDLISNATLRPQNWYHVVAVYKPSQYLRLYLNGAIDQEILNGVPAQIAEDDSSLHLGASGTARFKGRLDEVRLYKRALSQTEVSGLFAYEGGSSVKAQSANTVKAKPVFQAALPGPGGGTLKIYPRGGMELTQKGDTYRIVSTYSAPGPSVTAEPRLNNFNFAATRESEVEAKWQPRIVRRANNLYEVSASGGHYRLQRSIKILPGKLEVSDTFINPSKEVVGITLRHAFETAQTLRHWRLFGVEDALSPPDPRTPAINPTCFLTQPKSAIGVVVEDDVLRNQLEATPHIPENSMALGSRHFGLAAGARYTTAFTVYTGTTRYFDFINRVRDDWKVINEPVPGPASFLRADSWDSGFYREELEPHPDRFKAFLKRKSINVYLVCPWFRYWDGFDYSDDAYKKRMKEIIRTVKAANPKAKLLACLETYYYFIPRAQFGDTLPQDSATWEKLPYQMSMPEAATRVIDATPWKDSLYRDPQGRAIISPHDAGSDAKYKTKPLCMMVYPTLDNHFFRQRRQEIDYLLDDVGFDGVYMDMFGYGGEFTFERWDGHTVDLDASGKVVRKYSNLALLTAPARRAWLEHIHKKGKLALVNFGQPNTRALRTVPYFQFLEGAGIGHVDLKSPRPDASGAAGTQLSVPFSLGGGHEDSDAITANARLRAYLRYGSLYCHYYAQSLFPVTGAGSGEYGAFNHMFPLTPRRLFEGGIEGKERTLTTVSGTYFRTGATRPQILLFDNVGRLKPHNFKVTKAPGGWRVQVKLRDWQEVAVLAVPPSQSRAVALANTGR